MAGGSSDADPGSDLRDGIGCYPLFACRKWKGLAQDLPALADRLVSLCLITDPFGDFTGGPARVVRCWSRTSPTTCSI